MRPDDLATAVVGEMRSVIAPVHERIAAIEKTIDARIALAHTEAALLISREVAPLRERMAAIESRPPVPGPPGADGRDGRDGEPGPPCAGLQYLGVYSDGKSYEPGDIVTYAGSAWHCNAATTTRPGDGSADWVLMVKRGRDAKGAH